MTPGTKYGVLASPSHYKVAFNRIVPMERPEFVPFFREVIDHSLCTSVDAVLYGYIYWLTKLKLEKCFASNETLAELCKSTPNSIGNSLTTLERAGFIKRIFAENNPHKSRLEIIPLYAFGKVTPTGVGTSHPQVEPPTPTGVQSKSIEREQGISAVATAPRIELVEVKLNSQGEEVVPKKEKDPMLEKCALWWHKKCKEETGLAPSGGLVKTKGIIKNARKSLTYPQIQEMMNAWFEGSSLEPYETVQITRCLSNFQIDKYLAENV